jgi:hypothetical protein
MSLVTCQNGLLFLVFSRLFVVVVSSFTLAANVLGLCVRAGNRSTKTEFITKVQLKNYRPNFALQPA